MLSISMPLYNAAQFLDQSISSIMDQTCKDFELILVDDGSDDDSLEICEKWRKRYPNIIRVITGKNSGSLLARKKCIEESRYDYIYIMDADDYLLSNKVVEIIMQKIQQTEADMVFFDHACDGVLSSFPFEDGQIFETDTKRSIYDMFLNGSKLYPLWNKVFRRNLVDTKQDYQDYEDIVYGTDLYQTIPIISRAKKILYLKQCFYNYRFENNSNSIVHKFKKQSYITAKKNQMRLEKYCKEYNWNIDDLDYKLAQARMRRIATAAYKGKLIKDIDNISKYEYYRSIGEDEYFITNYSYCKIPVKRRLLLELLHHRLYFLLSIVV